MQRFLHLLLMTLLSFSVGSQPSAQPVRDVESGRDVGDGMVLYDTPYDPKTVSEITFVDPSVDHPYYEIVVPLGDWTEGTEAKVKKVRVNGRDCDSFYVFVDGYAHVHSAWINHKNTSAKNVVLVARALWHNLEPTRVEVDLEWTPTEGGPVTQTRTFDAVAPREGGGPTLWHRYQSFVASETAGLPRVNEPIEFSLTVRAEDCEDLEAELRLCAYDPGLKRLEAMPFQTFNTRSFPGTPPGTANENYLQHPSKALEVVFPATVPAHQSRVYLAFYDNPEAEKMSGHETDLVVSGPNLGATVENHFFITELSEKSGQIASFDFKPESSGDVVSIREGGVEVAEATGARGKAVPRITNSLSRAVHWNPDSFSDNSKWGHTFSWDPPDRTVVSARGPLLFRITNSGRMPDYTPQVHASVTYTFYPGVPYMMAGSVTQVRDPLNASAIRNGEIVLDSHLADHFVWQNKDGSIERIRTAHGANWQDEWAYRVDHDVRWIAMTHELDGYGVGTVVLDSMAFNPENGEATQHRPAFYLYYHHFWQIPLTYFTRAWVYPFSDYQRGPILPVSPGSTYVDRMAFVPFLLGETEEDRYAQILQVSDRLHAPLKVRWGR